MDVFRDKYQYDELVKSGELEIFINKTREKYLNEAKGSITDDLLEF